jgi:tetratricopeptide (TPR) repeat protein
MSEAHEHQGNTKNTDKTIQDDLKNAHNNAVLQFDKGCKKEQEGDFREAEKYFRAALKADPNMAEAAYHLGTIIFKDNPDESLKWLKKAHELKGQYPKYVYALASYTLQNGDTQKGISLLRELVSRQPQYVNSYILLGETYEKQGRKKEAEAVYKLAIGEKRLHQPAKSYFENKLKTLLSAQESLK